MDDDLTPNDSEALGVFEPDEPEEVKKDDTKQINRIAIAKSISDDVIGWFESMLGDYETVDSVKKTLNTHDNMTLTEAFAVHYQLSAEINNLLTKFKDRFTEPEDKL